MSSRISLQEYSVSDVGEIDGLVSRIRGKVEERNLLSATVSDIISSVEQGGDASLLELSRKYDRSSFSKPGELFVKKEEFEAARSRLGNSKVSAFKLAYRQIRFIARKQMNRFKETRYRTPLGFVVRERFLPLERVAGYVPGGLASYPSTVLMICGPAREAGVRDIVIITPPRNDGSVSESVLVTAEICNVKHVIKLGGAQAIAALACGTESIKKADLIAGPGNRYVTEAKRQVSSSGKVSIDALAGPTELLIIADRNADVEDVFEDIISQAEHGNRTLCGVVSDSKELIEQLKERFKTAGERKRVEEIKQSTICAVRTRSVNHSIQFAQAFAPEHLELLVSNPGKIERRITRSGLVLLGRYAPCSASDYVVGTDHILPTGGLASRFAGVSVESFLRRNTCVESTRRALSNSLSTLSTIAELEGLPNHAEAANSRFGERKRNQK